LIFRILERYTEDLIFLFFFLLSGLHLDIATLPKAAVLIIIFVLLRTAGKYLGANWGSRIVNADPSIRKYTAGGLLPQAGIVIGLVLSIYQKEEFKEISEILLTTIMGATIIHELIGPVSAKSALKKAGEIKTE
jgi:Kef-type K+ transport system membrane component KefB